MTPTALAACGEGENLKDTVNHWTFENNPDPGLGYLSLETHSALGSCTVPNVPSTLWNSMIAPLLPFKMSGFLWYQGSKIFSCLKPSREVVTECGAMAGESNSGAPERYAKCFPEKIRRWRSDFQLAEDTPYLFAQIAPWPNHNVGLISGIRYAQTAALDLAGVGMVVTADIGDPGLLHVRDYFVGCSLLTHSSIVPCSGSLPSNSSTVQVRGWEACRTDCRKPRFWQ